MAEFCRECFKRCIEPGALDEHIVLSENLDLCESCGEFKQVVLEYCPTNVFEDIKTGLGQAIDYEIGESDMSNQIDVINDEIPAYRKKSKKKGQPRADHKHTYETVLLTRYFHFNFEAPKTSEQVYPTKVCTICGRIDEIDKDESLYEVHPDPNVKRWMVWKKDLSEKALSLPKWRADAYEKFATKMED